MTLRRFLPMLAAAAALLSAAPAAMATHAQPTLDITKMKYEPIGHFKPGEAIPPDYGKSCETVQPLVKDNVFNPTGTFNSFDQTIYEYFCLPYRNQNDSSPNDPMGNGGEAAYGYCADPDPTDPLAQQGPAGAGTCPNHQLEFIEHYKATMLEVLKDFAPTFHEYKFEHPEADPEKGQAARNPAIVIAGADHPDEHIIIGSHYDQTDTGPASLWDSQEGHAEMIRVAKLMADYWKATGTRPSATVKFMPTDGEEDGSLGSADYVTNTVVPEWENKVRSYWNADPCAGGYPARRYGNPADVIPINVQIGISDNPRVAEFNEKVPDIVEQVLTNLDDTITAYPDGLETFVSTEENAALTDVGKHIFVQTDHPFLFSSDWTNFIAAGIPFFNPSPKVTGPSNPTDAEPSLFFVQNPYPDAVIGFHTPMDNLQTMSRFTGQDPLGNSYPEAYMKGMEFCSHLLAWGMLQHNNGGAQTAHTDPVAYYEALPNEATKGSLVTFDAGGSHQYADVASRKLVSDDDLQYKWDFGDGTAAAYGKVVKHAYRTANVFQSKLTVTNRASGKSATMSVPITVEEGGTANETDPPGQDVDKFPKKDSIVACQSTTGFSKISVKPSGKGLKFDFAHSSGREVKIDVLQASAGSKAIAPKRVATFKKSASFTWKGKKGLKKGQYFVRFSVVQPNGQTDRRAFAFDFTSKFKSRKAFEAARGCDVISEFRLSAPAFGGKRSLQIGFATTQTGTGTITVSKGSRKVKTIKVTVKTANRFKIVKVPASKLSRGEYKIVLKFGGKSATLYAKRV